MQRASRGGGGTEVAEVVPQALPRGDGVEPADEDLAFRLGRVGDRGPGCLGLPGPFFHSQGQIDPVSEESVEEHQEGVEGSEPLERGTHGAREDEAPDEDAYK